MEEDKKDEALLLGLYLDKNVYYYACSRNKYIIFNNCIYIT